MDVSTIPIDVHGCPLISIVVSEMLPGDSLIFMEVHGFLGGLGEGWGRAGGGACVQFPPKT